MSPLVSIGGHFLTGVPRLSSRRILPDWWSLRLCGTVEAVGRVLHRRVILGVIVLSESSTVLIVAGIILVLVGVALNRTREPANAVDRARCA